jgi:hypothetical protein
VTYTLTTDPNLGEVAVRPGDGARFERPVLAPAYAGYRPGAYLASVHYPDGDRFLTVAPAGVLAAFGVTS